MARKRHPTKADLLYQFKITFEHQTADLAANPDSRLRALAELHDYIQTAFGWDDGHLHQFEIDGEFYGPPGGDDFGFDEEVLDEGDFLLGALIPDPSRKTRLALRIRLRRQLAHEVLFEKCLPVDPKMKYPLCLDGKRACPPEDCGGPWGYGDLLEAIADPKHERHDELLEWLGDEFDPEAFDAEKATKEMRRVDE